MPPLAYCPGLQCARGDTLPARLHSLPATGSGDAGREYGAQPEHTHGLSRRSLTSAPNSSVSSALVSSLQAMVAASSWQPGRRSFFQRSATYFTRGPGFCRNTHNKISAHTDTVVLTNSPRPMRCDNPRLIINFFESQGARHAAQRRKD
jgi:hypothetical protein